jgi:hypothetical protein
VKPNRAQKAIRKVAIAGVVVTIASGIPASAVAVPPTGVVPQGCVLADPHNVSASTVGTLAAHRIIPLCN